MYSVYSNMNGHHHHTVRYKTNIPAMTFTTVFFLTNLIKYFVQYLSQFIMTHNRKTSICELLKNEIYS